MVGRQQACASVFVLLEHRMVVPFMEHLPQQVLRLPAVAPISQLAFPPLLIGEEGFQFRRQGRFQLCLLLAAFLNKDLRQLRRGVILQDKFLHPAGKARVGLQEVLHVVGVTGTDDGELAFVVLHSLHQLHDSLLAIAAAAAALHLGQGVGFVDEQHAAHGPVDAPAGLLSSLTHILAH